MKIKTEYICDNCKRKALSQKGVSMNIGIGYCKVGECEWCNNNKQLFSYSENKEVARDDD